VRDPPEGPLPWDRIRCGDALVDEAASRKVTDPAAQQGVVEPLDAEGSSRDEPPDIHQRSAADADRDAACQELDDVSH
jgi:hypothetical protein